MKPSRLFLYRLACALVPETRGFAFKRALLRWCGATVGANVRVNSSATILGNGTLTIGDDVWIGPRCFVSAIAPATLEILAHCDLAPGVMLLTGSHRVDPEGEHIGGEGYAASVTVGSGSWLGANATVLPGVELPAKSLVAAGAVVTKSPDAPQGHRGMLLAGVPARVKRQC